MKNVSKYFLMIIFCLPLTVFAWDWKTVLNKDWQAVDQYRAHNYARAFQQFSQNKSSDGLYNAGNAAAFMGRYKEALALYEKAIALNPQNSDAIFNRDIIKKLLNKQQQKQENKQNQQQSQQQNKQQNQQQQASNNNQDQQNKSQQSKQQSAQNNLSQNKQDNNNQNNNKQNSQNQPNQSTQNNNQDNSNQPQPTKNNEQMTQAMNSSQNQDEGKKQMLRRISDDPGGLLKQKFMRDYMRRHTIEESSDQGNN